MLSYNFPDDDVFRDKDHVNTETHGVTFNTCNIIHGSGTIYCATKVNSSSWLKEWFTCNPAKCPMPGEHNDWIV